MNRFRANPLLLAPLLAGLSMLGPFSIDAFFPAFGVMAHSLGVGVADMQQSLSAYLAAYALMSLLHGPLSDAFGRRGVIVWALVVFLIATIGCALASSFAVLIVCRVVQGVSAGAGMIVGRAIIRDRYEGPAAQRLMARVTLIFGIAPAIAPVIGGFVLSALGWRAIFGLLALFVALLVLASATGLPETHPRERRSRLAPVALLHTYAMVLADRRYRRLILAAGLNFSAIFIYIASAPAVVMQLLHLNERQFAWLFVPTIGGMMLGSFTSGRLAGRLSAPATVRLGYAVMALGLVLDLGVSLALPPGIPWTVLPIGVIGCGVSLAFPTLTLLILDRFPAARGAAASMQAACTLGVSSIVAGWVAPRVSQHSISLALTSTGLILAGFLFWRSALRDYRMVPDAAVQESPVGSG